METDCSRHRINGALMPNYKGKQVCLLGKAKDVDPKGMFFTLVTSDDQEVRVNMNAPLNEFVAGLVEVHGMVEGNTIACENYILFSEEASEKFDMSLYNGALKLMERCGAHYIQGFSGQ